MPCPRRRPSCSPPRKLRGDGHVRAVADAGHRLAEIPAAGAGSAYSRKRRRPATARLVLRLAGAQGLGQVCPVPVQAAVRHLQHAADVGGLCAVEKYRRLRRVRVDSVRLAEKAERDQRVEKVSRGSRMQPRRGVSCSAVCGFRASSVNSRSSTALNSVLEAQKPMPTCRIWSGVGVLMLLLLANKISAQGRSIQ